MSNIFPTDSGKDLMSEEKLTAVYRQLNEINGSGRQVQGLLRDIKSRSAEAKAEINVSGSKERSNGRRHASNSG